MIIKLKEGPGPTGAVKPMKKKAAHLVPRSTMVELPLHSPIRLHGIMLK
jgi:hypothetical protein